jgi:endonuclease I
MKKIILLLLSLTLKTIAQSGSPANPYYNGFNWNQTGSALFTALSTNVTSKHTNYISYTPGVWNASKVTDLDPANSNNVLLIYGWENGSDADVTNDLSRDKNANGGNSGDWNREHVYAKSLGTPDLDDAAPSDAGEDAHHLRSSDVQRNNSRGSLRFAAGSGNSGTVTGGWYPGNRWKGDVARMMMYMYLRYGSQCLPTGVAQTTATTVSSDANMVQLFLQWNAEDPVDAYEDQRNTYHGNTSNTYAQGNRNPFIDNPFLATRIWGGTAAENRWPTVILSNETFLSDTAVSIYPNPSNDGLINIETYENLNKIEVFSILGQQINTIENPVFSNNTFQLSINQSGIYLMKFSSENGSLTKKIVIQ